MDTNIEKKIRYFIHSASITDGINTYYNNGVTTTEGGYLNFKSLKEYLQNKEGFPNKSGMLIHFLQEVSKKESEEFIE